ncbi:LysE family transporter [Streptomyces iconiensis]|uniref:LysE family transporter n=1 Tax=Streptomyces iconiensis TaxID=1384038 RepID=A0ABT6ZPS0_9ACTN|nr:LysE family transporter [Streptomyces iconiensis]MDJ1131050.1 LysE family transporter [Streptomyces iconiensis]
MTNSMAGPLAETALGGLVAGYAVAVPVGALAVLLVSLTARTSFRVGAAGALGVATADGAYAAVAVLGGAAAARAVEPVADPLRWTAAGVLALMAVRSGRTALRSLGFRGPLPRIRRLPGPRRPPGPRRLPGPRRFLRVRRSSGSLRDGAALGTAPRAYLGLLGLTLLNPWAVIYFSALALGRRNPGGGGWLGGVVFVGAIVFASLSWQLLLASGGVALGRALTGVRGRAVTGLVSSVVIAALAAGLVVWG